MKSAFHCAHQNIIQKKFVLCKEHQKYAKFSNFIALMRFRGPKCPILNIKMKIDDNYYSMELLTVVNNDTKMNLETFFLLIFVYFFGYCVEVPSGFQ